MLQAKYASAQDKLQLVASSFSGLDTLTGESAEQVISVLGDLNVTRLIVTDAEGRCLLPMCSGVPQALSLASEAPARETQYLVTAREGAGEEELFLLWAAV